jgi:hypothetical protein
MIIIRIALDKKNAKTLIITYGSDQMNNVQLNKIRNIPGRKYDKTNKVWRIPYRYIKMFVNKFDDGIIKLEDDVDINYEENYFYDFLPEIELLNSEKFKKFARYLVSNAPKEYFAFKENTSNITDRISLTIDGIKLARVLATHQQLNEEEQDIILIAMLIKDFYGNARLCVNMYDILFDDNYDSLTVDVQYVYNKHWNKISDCVRTSKSEYSKAKTKLQKICNECNKITRYLLKEME